MKTVVVGIGGITNGGKSTLASRLQQQIPNSCLIAQDVYFKVGLLQENLFFKKRQCDLADVILALQDDSLVPVDSNGFKQYDVLDALHMDRMTADIDSWKRDPEQFLKKRNLEPMQLSLSNTTDVFVLIVEGFLIFNYRPLNNLYDKKYFIEIPYDICKKRRSSRMYSPPDPPGYFDGHVWPMYLKNRKEMEAMVSNIVFLDGLQDKVQLLDSVYQDVIEEIRLRG